MLKARYYPDGGVLSAQLMNNLSYAWRGMMHGVELLRHGVLWRIGDGSQVKIWEDLWLWYRRVMMQLVGNIFTKVVGLISTITGKWDDQLVNDTFQP